MDKSKCIIVNDLIANMRTELNRLIDAPDKLIEFINSNLKPKDAEKKRFGEVFTPLKLINEMLDKLPTNVWTDKNLKWFEPASGMGNFTICIYMRLLEQLRSQFKSDNATKKHILDKMLYMSELNPKNILICKQIFGVDYLNLHEGDTLTLDTQKEWGIKAFDIVVGNPPYNKPKNAGKKGGYGGTSLWDLFVVKSLEIWVKPKGYMLFIHPPSWRKPEHYLWEGLKAKQIIYLKIFTEKDSKKIFGCSTIVDYYVLQNVPIHKDTVIDAQDGKIYQINLRDLNFLAGGAFDDIKKLSGKNEVLYSSSIYDTRRAYISTKKTLKNNLPVVHNMTKDGLGFVYSSENRGQFGVPKVILSFGRHQYPYNDWKGEYGMTQICFGLKINSREEGDRIVAAINSPKFKEILKYTKWSTFQTDWRMFKYFSKSFPTFLVPEAD